ncbi:unnamed protein product [Ilex paraguariensis]|uniref:indole-3-pyruvate monooxygenase n=1 Tax=Ilex paraguariensis TaxID=185542 RepID=A0ABC8U296_9AQUA
MTSAQPRLQMRETVSETLAAMENQQPVAIVVGAGPSGLATAACLKHLSIPYIILEREDCFASLWKKKYSYDRLHLHLAKQFCELPHISFPSTYPTYVPKTDFLHYLDEYVSHCQISPLYKRSVESAIYDGGSEKWDVKAMNLSSGEIEEYSGRFLVVATGETADAFVPDVERLNTFTGEVNVVSREMVLPAIASTKANVVVFENGKSHPFDTIVFATGFKRSTNKWLKGDDYLLNDNGIAKASFPNNWKGKKGLYCAGPARRGLYGAAMDAQNIANNIKMQLLM